MKLALISDIHANRHALQACLVHARQQGVDQWAFLGDLVGYGADPVAVLDEVMALASQGAWVLRGNHDEMALHPPAAHSTEATLGSQGAQWTHDQLTPWHRAFLTDLPLTLSQDGLLLVHASADARTLSKRGFLGIISVFNRIDDIVGKNPSDCDSDHPEKQKRRNRDDGQRQEGRQIFAVLNVEPFKKPIERKPHGDAQ